MHSMGSDSSTVQAIADRLTEILRVQREIAANTPRLSYTADQAAARTGASRTRIYQMVADGELDKVANLGTTVLITHASLARRFEQVSS